MPKLNKTVSREELKITYDNIISWDPCYTSEICLEILKGKKEYDLMDFLNLDSVTPEDKLWVVLREEVLPERTLHEFAIWCAEYVLDLFKERYPNDKRPRLAIEAKKKWLNGEITDDELVAAWAAASDAARSARAAASAAAWAARAAAAWAARDAARDAACAEQLEQLKKMILMTHHFKTKTNE